MKTLKTLLVLNFLILSTLKVSAQIDSVIVSPLERPDYKFFDKQNKSINLDEFSTFQLEEFMKVFEFTENIAKLVPYGKENVIIEDELINLFNPENFKCDCDADFKSKVKSKIYKKKSGNIPAKLGFIPDIVSEEVRNSIAVKVYGFNSAIIANSFNYKYIDNGQAIIRPAYPKDVSTVKVFDIHNYIESNSNNFIYNIDCTGYISAAVSSDLGVSANSISLSAKSALKSENSLLLIYGTLYSPLYAAYKGTGEFSSNDAISTKKRIEILKGIKDVLPNFAQKNSTEIFLNHDYKILITSNEGSGKFNGEIDAGVKAGYNFVVGNASATGQASGKLSRSSEYKNFNSYVIKVNEVNTPDTITYSDLLKKISDLEKIK